MGLSWQQQTLCFYRRLFHCTKLHCIWFYLIFTASASFRINFIIVYWFASYSIELVLPFINLQPPTHPPMEVFCCRSRLVKFEYSRQCLNKAKVELSLSRLSLFRAHFLKLCLFMNRILFLSYNEECFKKPNTVQLIGI